MKEILSQNMAEILAKNGIALFGEPEAGMGGTWMGETGTRVSFNVQEVWEYVHKYPDIYEELEGFKLRMPYPAISLIFKNDGGQTLKINMHEEDDGNKVEMVFNYAKNIFPRVHFLVENGSILFKGAVTIREPSEMPYDLDVKYFKDSLRAFKGIAAISLAFINSKSAVLEEFDPNKELPKKRRQRLRREGKKLAKYKILHINPSRKPSAKTDNHIGAGVALHSVRGHFVTYTEGAPLFGKPWGVGTYWVGPYISGNADFGMTKKDYYVEVEEPI